MVQYFLSGYVKQEAITECKQENIWEKLIAIRYS